MLRKALLKTNALRAGWFLGLSFAAMLAASTVAHAASGYEDKVKKDPFYKAVLDTAKTTKGRALLDFFDQKLQEDGGRVHAISLWLRDNSINQKDPSKIDALYFLSYSDTLATIAASYKDQGDPAQYRGLMESSLLSLYMFELMGNVDAVRCQDPTALQAVERGMVTPRINDFGRPVYAMFTRADFEQIEKTALEMEEKTAARPPNLDICALGQARLRDLAEAPGVQQKDVTDPRYSGGTRTVLVPPPGYSFVPSITSDSEWAVARKKALSNVTSAWAKRYQDYAR
ncbi:MAG: hypothetical protein PW788_06495 [Micavibrio sp.]|nr:hypothetical protein [Micavibrio sp.]